MIGLILFASKLAALNLLLLGALNGRSNFNHCAQGGNARHQKFNRKHNGKLSVNFSYGLSVNGGKLAHRGCQFLLS